MFESLSVLIGFSFLVEVLSFYGGLGVLRVLWHVWGKFGIFGKILLFELKAKIEDF